MFFRNLMESKQMSLNPGDIRMQLNLKSRVEYSSETVEEELYLEHNQGSKLLRMTNCIFNHNVHLSLDASGTYNFDFTGSTFHGQLHILVTNVTNTKITLRKATFYHGLTIRCDSPIEIDCSEMKWDFQIVLDESKIDRLIFDKVKYATESAIHQIHAEYLNIISKATFKESELGEAYFSYSEFDCTANFGKCTFKSVHCMDAKFKFDVYLTDTEFGEFASFNGSEFTGTLIAFYLNQQSKQCLGDFSGCSFEKNVYFDSATFANFSCERSNFQKQASFNNSKFGEVDFIGSFFQNGADFTHTKYLRGGIETFRIIKSELLRAGNKVESLYYQSYEMHLYDEDKNWTTAPSEKILLLLNRLSTNHGIDWVRGIVFTFIVSVSFYSLYILSLPCKAFEWGWDGWASFRIASNYVVTNYFNFLSLFRDFSLLNDRCPYWLSSGIDFIGRIFIAYGVYQTIQAFRKYGKS